MSDDPLGFVRLMVLGSTALVAVLAWLMPLLTRPGLYFGVTVEPRFRDSEEGRRALRRYRLVVGSGTVAAFALGIAGRLGPERWLATAGPPMLVILAMVTGLLAARRLVLPHGLEPSAEREARLRGRVTRLPGGLAGQAGPFLLLAAATAWLVYRWPEIPQRVPIHWDLAARPDDWVAKSVAAPARGWRPRASGSPSQRSSSTAASASRWCRIWPTGPPPSPRRPGCWCPAGSCG